MLIRGPVATRLASIVLATALGGSGAGCVVGPRYSAPDVKLTPLYAAPAAAARSTTQPQAPLDDWWMGFGDSTLTSIVERVLQNNLDIAAALARYTTGRYRGGGVSRLCPPGAGANERIFFADAGG